MSLQQRTTRDLQERLATGLERHDELLACFDFDGTLAPIVDDPTRARPLPATERALERLDSHEDVTTAIVSGRSLADVSRRVDGPSVYGGNHGLELARDDSVAVHPVARKRSRLVERCCDVLEDRLEGVSGCRIENKRLTGTVHVRHVSREMIPVVEQETRSVVDRVGDGDLECSHGKAILEFGPRVPWTKGDAVSLLRSKRARDPFVLYVGDDVTDETVFRRLGPNGLGVAVGRATETAASCRVRSPRAVAHLLDWLVDATAGRFE
ncbi:trehalose-phosphatase [Natronosalvus caseinilyticus]|uniref:trehalose-phosphatase n=1 Tax=Natronosalvus caseinilyticus TaxID=2953747 RepID=UPI0028B165AB|nr:trehalose-phosphatase [Natronosalvus caseinilyticus]